MQIDISNIEELTEKYLNRGLSDEEMRQLEDAVSKDIALRQAFEKHRDIILAIELSCINNDIKALFKAGTEKVGEQVFTANRWKKYIGIAAAIICVLGVGYVFIFQKPANEKLYAEFFYKDAGLPVTMGMANHINFAEAMNAYKSNEYQKSVKEFKALLSQKPENDTLQYYLAMSYLNENNTRESIKLLQKIVDKKETVFKSEAEYFLALAYLDNNNIKEAKAILKYSDHEKAKELLTKMNVLYKE